MYHCSNLPAGCTSNIEQPQQPELTTDCYVMQSLVCSKEVQKIAELRVLATTLGVTVDDDGTITPAIQLTPDVTNIVSNAVLVKDKVINTGFVPVSIAVAGTATPLQVNLPFQQETNCKGACPEDTLMETTFQLEAVVVQGIPALGIGEAEVLLKVVLKTTLTVTRPVIAKFDNTIHPLQDVVQDRCGNNGMHYLNTSTWCE